MKRFNFAFAITIGGFLALSAASQAQFKQQTKKDTAPDAAIRPIQTLTEKQAIGKAERDGVGVRLDALVHFRGTWSQNLLGMGLVTGLDHSGDSQSFVATQIAATNFLKKEGLSVDTSGAAFGAKNIALVTVTCELPPFSSPGQRLDVTVSAFGDATSLRNGTLIFTPLKYPGGEDTFAVATGPISVGGYVAQSGGNKNARGFVTVGKIPGGAIVQKAVPTNTVFEGKMYLDLDQQDVTTAERIEEKITETFPELLPHALGADTVEVTLPAHESPSAVQSKLMQLVVQANTEAKVVVDERSGTIVIGGNVKISPCAIARGSISVQIVQEDSVSQPAAGTLGTTAATKDTTVKTQEETAQVTLLRPNTTVADLAEIFQTLKLHADDIIAILENLYAQGALKAKLVIQ